MITSGINTDNEDGLSNINLAEEKIILSIAMDIPICSQFIPIFS